MVATDPSAAPGTGALELLAGLFERAVARLVRLDPAGPDLLAPLDGRTLRLALNGASRGLRLRVRDGQLRPVPDEGAAPDLSLAIATDGLAHWLAQPPDSRGLPRGTRIEGDIELARVLERALSGFAPDFEQPFVELFGSVAGPQLARGMAGAAGWAERQGRELAASSAEYVTEEARLAAARGEIDAFNADVDQLRDDVERTEARIIRLMRDASGR